MLIDSCAPLSLFNGHLIWLGYNRDAAFVCVSLYMNASFLAMKNSSFLCTAKTSRKLHRSRPRKSIGTRRPENFFVTLTFELMTLKT